MQELRKKLKVLDATYGIGTGISLPHAITEWCLSTSTYVYTHFILVAIIDPFLFFPANTALIYHHGKLMALSEADKPCKFSVC
jgi:carotenoid cleavage dioxygenase